MQFADFISCGFDQIVNMAATLRYRHGGRASCPLVVRAPSGAGVHGACGFNAAHAALRFS